MTVPTSYPGVYIQELPSLVHTIQPAPTSIAVFVGYTHPFLTPAANFGKAIPLFSFADYQTNFGGLISCPWQADYVGQAVYQFFLNGGAMCYVVGLKPTNYYELNSATPPELQQVGTVAAATVAIPATGPGITFTALQPVGIPPATGTFGIPMQVVISNLRSSVQSTTAEPSPPLDTADIVITYGTTVETYRKVTIASLQTTSDLANGSPVPAGAAAPALQNSSLVTVTLPEPSDPQPTAYWAPPTADPDTPAPASVTYPLAYPSASAPQSGCTVINPAEAQWQNVFADYQPLDKVPVFNLLATPGIWDPGVASEGVAYCERKRAFYIMDTPPPETSGWDVNTIVGDLAAGTALSPTPPVSINAAVYYPWLATSDPITGLPSTAPPSGYVAGIYGQTDASAGVWQSPAGIGTALLGTTGVDPNGVMTDPQQGILNQNGYDAIRQFPGAGTVVFGARTTAGYANTPQQQWMYVAVRRTALFIEQSLYASLAWAVFEPNATPLWNALTQEVSAFMLSLFRQGAFAGTTPSQAFLVQCDGTTTTATDVANGVVNILVGFAPLVPAEFVVVQIAQLAGQAQS
jgi:phage tail sheath protein FI